MHFTRSKVYYLGLVLKDATVDVQNFVVAAAVASSLGLCLYSFGSCCNRCAEAVAATTTSLVPIVEKRKSPKRTSYFLGCLVGSFFSGFVSIFSGLAVLV